jgi:hypothetical protein
MTTPPSPGHIHMIMDQHAYRHFWSLLTFSVTKNRFSLLLSVTNNVQSRHVSLSGETTIIDVCVCCWKLLIYLNEFITIICYYLLLFRTRVWPLWSTLKTLDCRIFSSPHFLEQGDKWQLDRLSSKNHNQRYDKLKSTGYNLTLRQIWPLQVVQGGSLCVMTSSGLVGIIHVWK